MTFRQFVFNNVLRNKRLYVAYFLSSLFTVMVFFTFAMFAFHPALSGADIHFSALYGMSVAGGIIYVFSFFFVLYSMSSFLQSRKREFGLLMTLGASSRQIRRMVFLENMIIGFFATVGGILLGLIFAKLILLIAENVLIISETLYFYVPVLAIIITFVSFIVLFLCISFFVSVVLRTKKLTDLIKGNKKWKGEPKASFALGIIAALLLLAGYGVALYVKGMEVLFAMVPVIIVVVIGTYLLFTQLSVYVIRRLKGNRHLFFRKTNMLLFSDLAFRMKDNARTFFLVTIISTVAFSAIGTLYGFHSYLTRGIKDLNPFSYTYFSFIDDSDERIEKDVQRINAILQEENIKADMERIEMTYYHMEASDTPVLIVKASDYNRFARLNNEKEVSPDKNEAVVVNVSARMMGSSSGNSSLIDQPIILQNDLEIKPSETIESELLPEIKGYYIVHDDAFAELGDPLNSSSFFAFKVVEGEKESVMDAGRKMMEQTEYRAQAIDYMVYEIDKAYGPVLFIGLFIGIVFFVSAGSFLYFRLYSDLDDDKYKFQSITKIGLTVGELKKVVNRQTAILFFAPIIVALIHGAVALTALSRFFDYNITEEALFVLGGFAVIQIVYFFIAKLFYVKQIKETVYR